MTTITRAQPRNTIRVTFDNDLVLEGPVGATAESFLKAAADITPDHYDSPIMGAIIDGRLRELAYPLYRDAQIQPVLLSSSDGGRIYRRSLVMLLTTAVEELWPGTKVAVSYAVPDGGFYCRVMNRDPLTKDELAELYSHMRHIVEQDEPISKRLASMEEANALFQAREDHDKVRLLEQRTRDELVLYRLRDREDYYYGYMVPSTAYLQLFRLIVVDAGFILQYPRKETTGTLGNIAAYNKLTQVFQEADHWLQRMGVEDIGRLNSIVRADQVHELILVAEALHEQRVARIASEIRRQHEDQGVRIVLIAGPSSSGKTTFSKRLAIQLLANGLRPFTLEMDNYFVDRELTPRDESGDYDFESLYAINLKLFNEQLLQLIAGQEVQLPRFDFMTGQSVPGRIARLNDGQIIIIEGIHGLNPALVPDIPKEVIHRVYVSALTQLNIDWHNRVPTTDVRLLRRIVRDAQHRGYNAADTLKRWGSVRRGEKHNIFPFQENADVMFNSALTYELAALRPMAEPLLLQVRFGTPEHIEANRLLSFLNWVQPLTQAQMDHIPDTSLLREFIGGSSLQDYHPYRPAE
ncbi:MAG: nucleoside kinase [Anaerolineaceae bacterium]|nr:nucleoside kinase [Anaerolineaceae bacterium]